MSAPEHLPKNVSDVWEELAKNLDNPGTARGPAFEAYCGQIARLRDAQNRISEEGLVIADAKGQPIAHPALVVEKQAQVEIRAWSKEGKFRLKTTGEYK